MKNVFISMMSLVLLVGSAYADEKTKRDPIATDRPDFVESSLTVGRGVFQFETSIAQERVRVGSAWARTTLTPTLFRYGVSANAELRMETDGLQNAKSGSATQRGTADTSLGMKLHVQDGEGSRPSVAWLFHADLPSGSSAFRGSQVRPSVRAVFEWELPKDTSVGVMPGLVYDHDGASRFTTGIFAVTVSHGWSEKLRSFVEASAQELRPASRGGNTITLDAGVTYLLNDDLQLDLVTYQGATKDYRGKTWGLGVSRRY